MFCVASDKFNGNWGSYEVNVDSMRVLFSEQINFQSWQYGFDKYFAMCGKWMRCTVGNVEV